MSSRALRRLQANTDFDVGVVGLDEEDVENDEIGECDDDGDGAITTTKSSKDKRKKKKQKAEQPINPFELLNDQDEEDVANITDNEEDYVQDVIAQISEEAQGAKKKKKKAKKKGKDKQQSVVDNLNFDKENNHLDEVEASLLEVNRLLGDPGTACTDLDRGSTPFTVNMKPLLHIDYRSLNPETEMKRMFGSEVFRGERGEGNERNQRNRRQRNRPLYRSTKLVQAKDTWHTSGGSGLSMKNLGEEKGFLFEHSLAYQQLQHKFLDGIESGIPENIFSILQENPYHIDTLISLADFYNMNEDFQTGAECIEKAIYGLECAFHSMFNLAAGNCYLDFKRRENRAIFICLFKHINNLGRRGCNRTAFEFCKVLLSLDPSTDPLNCLSMIDFYALRCDQYDYLLRLEAEVAYSSSKLQTPNFAFSVALAHFKLATQQRGDTGKADGLLQNALLLYPMMLPPLLDKCNIQPDPRVAGHAFFKENEAVERSSELGRLVQLYCNRCETCWKEGPVLTWLERNVTRVMDVVDGCTDTRLADFPSLRRQHFKHPPPSILRHYNLSGIPVPASVSTRNVYGHDPYPPSDSVTAYVRPPPRATRAASSDRGMMRLLLESLLPSFNPNEPVGGPNRRQQGQEQQPGFAMGDGLEDRLDDAVDGAMEGARAIPQQLQTSVNAIMDAMRHLLNRAVVIPPGEGEGEGEDPENEAAWEDEEEDYQAEH